MALRLDAEAWLLSAKERVTGCDSYHSYVRRVVAPGFRFKRKLPACTIIMGLRARYLSQEHSLAQQIRSCAGADGRK
jgi:hypothetical protein